MGLDMYLRATKYTAAFEFSSAEEKQLVTGILEKAKLPQAILCAQSPSITIAVTVAYWRKANAIHAWFVRECQDGKDECQDSYVSREQLETLLALCKEIIAKQELGPEKLPTQSGFFFGGTTYGSEYLEDIQCTISQLEPLLQAPELEHWSFEYHSSW